MDLAKRPDGRTAEPAEPAVKIQKRPIDSAKVEKVENFASQAKLERARVGQLVTDRAPAGKEDQER